MPAIVHELSQYIQLEPGDLICTGTPQGVALSGRFSYLADGDVMEMGVAGLGQQRSRLVAASARPSGSTAGSTASEGDPT